MNPILWRRLRPWLLTILCFAAVVYLMIHRETLYDRMYKEQQRQAQLDLENQARWLLVKLYTSEQQFIGNSRLKDDFFVQARRLATQGLTEWYGFRRPESEKIPQKISLGSYPIARFPVEACPVPSPGPWETCRQLAELLRTNKGLGAYLRSHPDFFDQQVRPRLEAICGSPDWQLALSACDALLAWGDRSDKLKDRIEQISLTFFDSAREMTAPYKWPRPLPIRPETPRLVPSRDNCLELLPPLYTGPVGLVQFVDDKTLVTVTHGRAPNLVIWWKVPEGKELRQTAIPAEGRPVLSDNGLTLIVLCDDNTRVFSLPEGKLVCTLPKAERAQVSPDGTCVGIVRDYGQKGLQWSVVNLSDKKESPPRPMRQISPLLMDTARTSLGPWRVEAALQEQSTVLPDGSCLVNDDTVGRQVNRISPDGRMLQEFHDCSSIRGVSRSGNRYVGYGGSWRIFNSADNKERIDTRHNFIPVLSPDGRYAAVVARGYFRLWDMEKGKELFADRCVESPQILGWRSDKLFLVLRHGQIEQYDKSLKRTGAFPVKGCVCAARISDDYKPRFVFTIESEQPRADTQPVSCPHIESDNRISWIGRWVRSYDLETGKLVKEHILSERDDATDLEVDPSDRLVAVRTRGRVSVIDMNSGKTLAYLPSDVRQFRWTRGFATELDAGRAQGNLGGTCDGLVLACLDDRGRVFGYAFNYQSPHHSPYSSNFRMLSFPCDDFVTEITAGEFDLLWGSPGGRIYRLSEYDGLFQSYLGWVADTGRAYRQGDWVTAYGQQGHFVNLHSDKTNQGQIGDYETISSTYATPGKPVVQGLVGGGLRIWKVDIEDWLAKQEYMALAREAGAEYQASLEPKK